MVGRIQRELRQIENDEDGITASVGGQLQIFPSSSTVDAAPRSFNAVMAGPEDSPYCQGIFTLRMDLPADYPFRPPYVYFTTPIWHPNVDFETGEIGIDVLDQGGWMTSWTLQALLLTIYSLLTSPILDGLPYHSHCII